jgi:hypothetical protein
VTSTAAPPTAARAGWFANRPLAVKFGVLIGVVVLAFGGLLTAVLVGNSAVRDANTTRPRRWSCSSTPAPAS